MVEVNRELAIREPEKQSKVRAVRPRPWNVVLDKISRKLDASLVTRLIIDQLDQDHHADTLRVQRPSA